MTPHEKHQRLALVLAVLKKLDLTPGELHTYAQALDILKGAEDNQTDPMLNAAQLVQSVTDDPWGAVDDAQAVADMVEEIIQVEGKLI